MTERRSSSSFSSVDSSSGIVHDLLDGHDVLAELVAEGVDLLEGEVGGQDGAGHLVLALLDALGQRDLALAREEGHPAHLAEVEADGILGAADRARA